MYVVSEKEYITIVQRHYFTCQLESLLDSDISCHSKQRKPLLPFQIPTNRYSCMFVQCIVLKMRLLHTKVKEGAGNIFSGPTPDRRVVN